MDTKMTFISYAWDSEEHKDWVLKLANNLVENGIDVIFDQYDLVAGKEMTYFMEKALSADKILVVMSPGYKVKADERQGGAGYEYSLITKRLYDSEPDKSRIIPILRLGDKDLSCPTYLSTHIFHDMRNDEKYPNKFFELTKILRDKPLVMKPQLGREPDFENAIPDVEKILNDYQNKSAFVNTKRSTLRSVEGVAMFEKSADYVINYIKTTLDNYRNNFGIGFHVQSQYHPKEILFSTVNYTFYFGTDGLYTNSAEDAVIYLNFFKGPVGLPHGIDYDGEVRDIYRHTYKFDLDNELKPIFVRKDNSNIKLNEHEVATLAVREVIAHEIKLRSEKLN